MGVIDNKKAQNTLMTISGSTYVHLTMGKTLSSACKQINDEIVDALQKLYFTMVKENGIDVGKDKFNI